MQYLDKYNNFNESNSNEDTPKRSERLLTQAQRESNTEEVSTQKSDVIPTLLFTDVVGSSKMWSDDSYTMMQQLRDHHKLVESLAEKHKGWIVKTIGDAFMVYFEPSNESLKNSLKFAKELILSEKKYQLRIGICQGNVEQESYRIQKVELKDFYGNPVNTASRMESKVAGGPGIIAFSAINGISSNLISNLSKEIGKVTKVDLSKYDLRGASVKEAYKIKIK